MAAPVSFSCSLAPAAVAHLPALARLPAPWPALARKHPGCPAPRELPDTPTERTPRVFLGQRPPPRLTRRPVSGSHVGQPPLAAQAATQQQNRSLFYLQAPQRLARRANVDTVP